MLVFILHLYWLLIARGKSLYMFRQEQVHGFLPLEISNKISENLPGENFPLDRD